MGKVRREMLQISLIEIVSKNEVSERPGQFIGRVVEVLAKSKMSDGVGKEVSRLIKARLEREVSQ